MLEFNLFADYFQFYIQDESADGDLSDAWSDEAVEQLFAVRPGVVGIGTVRNMDVPVTVEVLETEKAVDLSEWDHVVDAARIPVAPGTYRLRACYAGLDTLSDGGLQGSDRYHLQLWPAPAIEPVVLKQRAA
ncbi:hypothetical protein GmRootV213_47640 [Variovorax sp. V213]|uniref:hypothetical protein n=1 Tax=Variovorax sp. V213 TaxID=3065955 RepID=UPI0034E88473